MVHLPGNVQRPSGGKAGLTFNATASFSDGLPMLQGGLQAIKMMIDFIILIEKVVY
jgi:hypothetical protein